MEILLLADMSVVYGESGELINYNKLNAAIQEIENQYGEDISSMLIKMIEKEEYKRPRLADLKRMLKTKKNVRKSFLRF